MRPGVLLMVLRKILHRMLAMCREAWILFLGSVWLTVALLLGAVIALVCRDAGFGESHRLYMTAMALQETGQAVLLIGVIFSACLEDHQSSRR